MATKKLKTFTVSMQVTQSICVEIEAKDMDEAREKAENGDYNPSQICDACDDGCEITMIEENEE